MKTFHFLAGLPRSGSTLLTALLNQNPIIHASTNSPLLDTIHYTEEYLLYKSEQYKAHPKPEAAHRVISSIPHNYYYDIQEPVIIDKSRGWVNQIRHIKDYITSNPKIICTVRDIVDIMASFLALVEKSKGMSFIDKGLLEIGRELNNDNRCEFLMSHVGIIGMSYHALMESLKKGNGKHILFVEYEDLIKNPQNEMDRIHEFLNLPTYQYQFSNVKSKYDENDTVYGLDDMHTVRSKVEKVHRDNSKYISEYILNKYRKMEFWRKNNTPRYSIFGI
jgi:sulfotransferase